MEPAYKRYRFRGQEGDSEAVWSSENERIDDNSNAESVGSRRLYSRRATQRARCYEFFQVTTYTRQRSAYYTDVVGISDCAQCDRTRDLFKVAKKVSEGFGGRVRVEHTL
jgi:hypothetical protein